MGVFSAFERIAFHGGCIGVSLLTIYYLDAISGWSHPTRWLGALLSINISLIVLQLLLLATLLQG